MKSSTERSEELRRQRSQAVVETHIAAIFRRMPMLSGFALRHDLEVTDIAISTWPGHTAGQELYDDLMQALADLAEERPDAVEVLRGRAFARAFH
jgi:hypothetical protein